MPVAEQEPDGQRDHEGDPECRKRKLGELARLREQQAGVVGDEAERVDEKGGEHLRDPAPRREATLEEREQCVGGQGEQNRETSPGEQLRPKDVRLV